MPKIIPIENREQWLALRAEHGGSSEAPALFDLGYESLPSRWSLWGVKSGLIEPPSSKTDDRMWWGEQMEEVCARAVAKTNNWDLRKVDQYVIHDDEALRMGSTVDRYIVGHEYGPGVLECKNRDYLEFRDNYTDEDCAPRDKIQLAHQLACDKRLEWGCLGVIVGGNTLTTYTYSRSDLQVQIEAIEKAWGEFWPMVVEKKEPELSVRELPAWLQVHGKDWQDEPVLEPTAGPEAEALTAAVAAYATAKANLKEIEAVEEAAKKAFMEALGLHKRARTLKHFVKINPVAVKASEIRLPADIRAGLLDMRSDMIGSVEQDKRAAEIVRLLDDAIGWVHIARKAGFQTRIDIKPLTEAKE